MTKEQEEAIEVLKKCWVITTEHLLDEENKKVKEAIEIVLSMLEEKEKELQMLKEFKEIANSKVTELNPIRISKSKSINK